MVRCATLKIFHNIHVYLVPLSTDILSANILSIVIFAAILNLVCHAVTHATFTNLNEACSVVEMSVDEMSLFKCKSVQNLLLYFFGNMQKQNCCNIFFSLKNKEAFIEKINFILKQFFVQNLWFDFHN